MKNLHFKAVIFDLDGVITDTAALHSIAWKRMFDEFLHFRSEGAGTDYLAFSHERDYLPYVDGKPRYQGVSAFLQSRQVQLLYGDPSDPPHRVTICGLGNRKNQIFNQMIAEGNVTVFQSTVDFIHQLIQFGIRLGVASSSKNCLAVLNAVGLQALFETRVDGLISVELGLKGKPEPDIFTTACQNLGVINSQAVVIEDAVSGVQAGRKGRFGLVLGIAREGNAPDLIANGADLVVTDISEIDIPTIDSWFKQNPR